MRTLASAWLIARKDLRLEFKTKESLNASGAFAVVILLLFSFVLDVSDPATKEVAGGFLWLVLAFAGALVFNRSFARELPNECLDTLLSSRLSAASLVLGKALANLALLFVVEAISLFVFGVFYDIAWWQHFWAFAGVCLLATWGISIVGAVFGALTVNLRLRELMLPVLIYPLLIPLLIAAIEITNNLFTNEAWGTEQWLWIRVLVTIDIVFSALTVALSDTILVN